VRLWIGFIWFKSALLNIPAFLFIFYYNKPINNSIIKVYISQQCMIYTPTYFDIFTLLSVSLNVRLHKLLKCSKFRLLKIQFNKIRMFHI